MIQWSEDCLHAPHAEGYNDLDDTSEKGPISQLLAEAENLSCDLG